jgi:hypothetical protein
MRSLFRSRPKLADELRHFFECEPDTLPILNRAFSRVDLPNLELAIQAYGQEHQVAVRTVGYMARGVAASLTENRLAELIGKEGWLDGVCLGSLQYRSVDVDVDRRMECLNQGLHLIETAEGKLAVHLRPESPFSCPGGLDLEVMAEQISLAAAFVEGIRERIHQANVYRGKIISLGMPQDRRQMMIGADVPPIAFHRFSPVSREEVILPAATLALIERNTLGFLRHAETLRRSGRSLKRGLLLHGRPGTGKTYTVRWLAQSLENVTTLLLTGEQLWLVKECSQLARMLAPSLVIMEDVDLIAAERDESRHPAYQITLHQLLNEMDGLAGDAPVLFLLTTNRPDVLEPALAARPGRADQAIEFPLPDAECRQRLIDLYGRGLTLALRDADRIIAKPEGASPAFIQELIRKAALFAAEEAATAEGTLRLTDGHFDLALEELLLGGGELTRNLLGFRDDARLPLPPRA